jgi:hypothetical protein
LSAIVIAAALAGAGLLQSAGPTAAAPAPSVVGLDAGLVISTDSVMAAARVP